MTQKTYIQIIDTWKQIATNHLQVKTFTTGDIFEVDANEVVFPQVHLITEQAQLSKHELTFNWILLNQMNQMKTMFCQILCNIFKILLQFGRTMFKVLHHLLLLIRKFIE